MSAILVFGRDGQVGRAVQSAAPVHALGRDDADLCSPDLCADVIRHHRPRMVINAAAFTDVDRAEDDEALATVINGHAPAAMAKACADLRIPFVHLSSDYVFSGAGGAPWRPADPVAPQNAYGRSKLVAEQGIRASGACHAILRTSWVFSAYGTNFVKTMLRLASTRPQLSVVDDQIGGPTYAGSIASACLAIGAQLQRDRSKSGTYHFSGAPDVSWCDFAREIVAATPHKTRIEAIPSHAYPTRVTRPLNSRLDCGSIRHSFAIDRPDWRVDLRLCLHELEVGDDTP